MSRRKVIRGARTARLACWLGAIACAVPAHAQTIVHADGTLQVPAMTLPQSELVSPQFRRAYVDHLAMMRAFPKVPALDAPKREWDEFDAALDRLIEKSLRWSREHYPVEVRDTKIAGVRVGIITPKPSIAPANARRVLINLHGGGFLVSRGLAKGQLESIAIASILGIEVITVDYRQAPYHRYPAASEDVAAVYRELLQRYEPQAIGIFGCSAGAILTAQAVAWFQARGLPRPGAVALLCGAPGTIGKRGDSNMWNPSGVPDAAPIAIRRSGYLDEADPADPKAFPETSDVVLAAFPPTLLVSGTRSTELSSVIVAHARFLKLGVDAELYIMEGGWHGAVSSADSTPEGREASEYIARWFDRHLARSP